MSKRAPLSDPQRYQVYALENEFLKAWLQTRQPLSQLQTLADKACKRWGCELIPIRFKPNTPEELYGCFFEGPPARIELYNKKRVSGRNIPVLLHEVAHHIESELFDEASHGPKWAAVVMDLYDHYKIVPEGQFRKLAKKFKVKIAKL